MKISIMVLTVIIFFLCGCDIAERHRKDNEEFNNAVHRTDSALFVGNHFIFEPRIMKRMEETTEQKKFLVYFNVVGHQNTYITVKHDTIVAIWSEP